MHDGMDPPNNVIYHDVYVFNHKLSLHFENYTGPKTVWAYKKIKGASLRRRKTNCVIINTMI